MYRFNRNGKLITNSVDGFYPETSAEPTTTEEEFSENITYGYEEGGLDKETSHVVGLELEKYRPHNCQTP